jgi:hypothetical protein
MNEKIKAYFEAKLNALELTLNELSKRETFNVRQYGTLIERVEALQTEKDFYEKIYNDLKALGE